MAIIMQFFFCLFLLSCIFVEYSLTINDNNYIRCISHCPQLIIFFSEPSTFPPVCQENDTNTNIYDYGLVCNVEYTIDYDTEEVYVKLRASNDTRVLEDQKPSEHLGQKIRFRFSQDVNERDEVVRSYDCNTKDDCAKDFYLSTINNLVNDGKSQLDAIKNKLYNETALMGKASRRHCTDSALFGDDTKGNKTSIRCGDGLCYARVEYHELNPQQNTKTQKCEHGVRPGLRSEIEHHAPKLIEKEKVILEYRCNKHVCNRNDMIPKIQELIKEFTNWNPTVATPESKSIDEKQNNNSSIKQTISSCIWILFLILIQLFI